MSKFPAYTAEENLMRIIMDKKTKYLLVEGPFDTAIYSEIVSVIIRKYNISHEPVTVYGGGKQNILDWIEKQTPKNLSIILDMDFDNPDLEYKSKPIISLKKYSIENYFFDEEVAKPLVANLLSKSLNDIGESLSFSELKEHWDSRLMELMHVLFYYQKIYSGNKEKWNSKFINKGQGSWEICPERVNELTS
ncbi:uncharacterized protein DUF4435 [Shewanella putrefaciens]|nr:uncharacterized protein DUF4435 [Shewanella putrefaciens]